MPEIKETKLIAQRIDIRYPSKPSWFRWWRRWISILTLLAALAWTIGVTIGYVRTGKHEHLLNPAPVTMVHAHFENNCKACHVGNKEGGFSKAVSDNACLSCHSGGRHHPTADLNPGQKGDLPHLISQDHLKSADCTVCHVEHQGKEANLASDDRLCLQCHQNLALHGGKNSKVPNTVTAFDGKGHPQFGRLLPTISPSGPLADTTWHAKDGPLKFSHLQHVTAGTKAGLPIKSCSTCHTIEESPSTPSGRRADMRPVSYEQHCRQCHPLALPRADGLPANLDLSPPLAHQQLDLVRGQLSNLPAAYLQVAARSPMRGDVFNGKSAATWAEEQAANAINGDAGASPAASIKGNVSDRLDILIDHYTPWNPNVADALSDQKADLLAAEPKHPMSREDMAEHMVAAFTKNNCQTCHVISGEPQIIYRKLLELTLTFPKPSPPPIRLQTIPSLWSSRLAEFLTPAPARLHTVPTGIPSTPRRWFAHSEFAHAAHRDISCLECHQGMDKDADEGIAHMPTMSGCVECHHPPRSEARGTSNNCITCHAFHDRSVEEPLRATTQSTTQPPPPIAADK